MKKIIALGVAAILMLTGCGQSDSQPDTSSSQNEADQFETPQSGSSTQSESSVTSGESGSELPDARINGALELIPGGERLLESDQGLFLLKEYGFDMKWMEANQIEHLDRGTPPTDAETYFLLLPKYTGSQVLVERLKWDGKDFSPTEILYNNKSTPENYGLVLTSNEPEGGPNLRVTVTYENEKYSNTFSYDGRGDRPEVRVLPDDQRWWESAALTKLFQSPVGNRAIQMEIPEEWEISGPESAQPRIIVELIPEGKRISYNIWFVDTSELAPKKYLAPFDEGYSGDLSLADGRQCYYTMATDRPPAYYYALEIDGLTVVLMSHFLEEVPDPLPEGGFQSMLRPPHEAMPDFVNSLQSLTVIS